MQVEVPQSLILDAEDRGAGVSGMHINMLIWTENQSQSFISNQMIWLTDLIIKTDLFLSVLTKVY